MKPVQVKDQSISDSEWDVMRIIWTLKKVSSTQVIDELQTKKNWSESTIKTLLRRLVKKGLLSTKKEGRRFIYSATINQTDMMVEAANELLSKICNMHKGEVLLKLLTNSPVSKGDLEKLKSEINKKEKTAPDMVACNCLSKSSAMCER